MGRKALPTQLKVLRGNPGKRRLNDLEPKPPPGRPEPLECLSPGAMVHFARLVDQLHVVRVVTVNDGAALSALAQSIATYEESTRVLGIEGLVTKGKEGQAVRNPWFIVQKQAWEQMQRGLSDFGLTASSRSKIHAAPKSDDEDESRFFGT